MTRKPSYRFAGYTEPWEEKKLGEVSTHRSGTSIEKYFAENGVYKVISIGSYGLDGEYIDQGIRAISNEVTDKKIVKENELTMVLNDKTSNGTIIGRTLLIKSSNEFVVNQRTEIISPKEILDSQYAYVLLNGNFREQVKKIVQGGTQIYVNYSSVEQLKLPLPSLPEQTAIGSFFQDIDQLIILQQRKLEVLKEQKKTYLKLLFPAKGQTKPALRFAGFEDDWKEVKLGDLILRGGSGGTPKSTVAKYYGGDIPFLSITDISNSGKYLKRTEKTITNEGLQNSSAWVVPEGAISLAMYASVGKLAILGIDCATSQAFYNMVFEDDIVRNFVYITLEKANIYNEWGSLISTGTQANLNAEKVKNFSFLHPSKPEQQAIGTFFQDLDKAIAKQEEKVNQLKESKQTLLRKMFI